MILLNSKWNNPKIKFEIRWLNFCKDDDFQLGHTINLTSKTITNTIQINYDKYNWANVRITLYNL